MTESSRTKRVPARRRPFTTATDVDGQENPAFDVTTTQVVQRIKLDRHGKLDPVAAAFLAAGEHFAAGDPGSIQEYKFTLPVEMGGASFTLNATSHADADTMNGVGDREVRLILKQVIYGRQPLGKAIDSLMSNGLLDASEWHRDKLMEKVSQFVGDNSEVRLDEAE